MVKCFLAKNETRTLGFIEVSGHARTSPGKLAVVKDWLLPETHKHIKSFVASSSFYRKFIHHFADRSAPFADFCRKYLPRKVAYSVATSDAFKTLKAMMISPAVLLIPKSVQDT